MGAVSVTAVTPEAAAAIAEVPGHLVLSGLVKLESVPLARKLAQRPAALSLPYLKEIGPEVAAALAETTSGLTLAALTEVSPEVQEALATTAAALSLPGLESLDSLPLTRKLAEGYASAVVLPGIRALTVEQAGVIAAVDRPFFLGGTFLPLSVMSEEVATALAASAGRLALGAGSISEPALKMLVDSRVTIEFRGVTSFSDEQVRIMAAGADRVGAALASQPKISMPMLTTLDSAALAEKLLRCGAVFTNVTEISPAAAEALGRVPEAESGKPNASLNFSSLAELSPETARLIMNRRWAKISLPALRDATPEAVRSVVRRASCVTLGLTTITPEVAAVFGEMASDTTNLGGGTLEFPCLSEFSPEAARILVTALNRGEEVKGGLGLNRSPQLFIGGRGLVGISPPLTAALARELAQYRGRLSFAGLREFSPEAAATLAAYRGPSIDLSGPATDRPSPELAAALATIPANLVLPIQVLDSVPLAEKVAQSNLSLDGLNTLSADVADVLARRRRGDLSLDSLSTLSGEVAKALAQHKGGVSLDGLSTLSDEAAKALAEHEGGLSLAGLSTLSDEAAKALAAADKLPRILPRIIAFESPDSVAIAQALATKKGPLALPNLGKISPKTLSALLEKGDIQIPLIETLNLIPEPDGSPTDDFVIPEGFQQPQKR